MTKLTKLTRQCVQVYKTSLGLFKRCEIDEDVEVNVIDSRGQYDLIDSPVKGWVLSSMLKDDDFTPPPPVVTPPVETGLNMYRTLHPYSTMHNGIYWPARPDYDLVPNWGSFDVCSRLYPKPKKADGGAIPLTPNQWEAIRKKNNYSYGFEKWAVGGTQRIMMWKSGSYLPVFHYPLIFGGNMVNVLEFQGKFARIATWPEGRDVPDDLPEYYWHRCWCVYKSKVNPIRDAPCGILHTAYPAFMLALAHDTSAWVFMEGLRK